MKHQSAITADFRLCQEYTRHYAKTFYFASHVLPREKRMAAYALYAFCRRADELADSGEAVSHPVRAAHNLAALHDEVRRIYSGRPIKDPMLRAFRDTVLHYRIPEEYVSDLLRGVAMDVTKKAYRTFTELDDYCYGVASTVGLMMTKVFGASHEEAALRHAADMGKAMQLTNIARDVGEDYRRGRRYLPLDEMERFGVREEHLHTGTVSPQFVELMKFQIERARAYYDRAAHGIPLLTNDGSRFCVKLMSRTYAHILCRIEKIHYDTLSRRAYVPLLRKIRIAFGASFAREVPPASDQYRTTPASRPTHSREFTHAA